MLYLIRNLYTYRGFSRNGSLDTHTLCRKAQSDIRFKVCYFAYFYTLFGGKFVTRDGRTVRSVQNTGLNIETAKCFNKFFARRTQIFRNAVLTHYLRFGKQFYIGIDIRSFGLNRLFRLYLGGHFRSRFCYILFCYLFLFGYGCCRGGNVYCGYLNVRNARYIVQICGKRRNFCFLFVEYRLFGNGFRGFFFLSSFVLWQFVFVAVFGKRQTDFLFDTSFPFFLFGFSSYFVFFFTRRTAFVGRSDKRRKRQTRYKYKSNEHDYKNNYSAYKRANKQRQRFGNRAADNAAGSELRSALKKSRNTFAEIAFSYNEKSVGVFAYVDKCRKQNYRTRRKKHLGHYLFIAQYQQNGIEDKRDRNKRARPAEKSEQRIVYPTAQNARVGNYQTNGQTDGNTDKHDCKNRVVQILIHFFRGSFPALFRFPRSLSA